MAETLPDFQSELTADTTPHPAMIEHRQANVRPNRFVPDTRLVLTTAFRTSGLLAALPDQEARTLLAVLTLYTPDGRFTGTAPEIAAALGLQGIRTQKNMQERLRALLALSFRGAPVLVEVSREQALPLYVPGPHIVRHAQEETFEEISSASKVNVPVNRETVLALNRAKYTRPRQEAERSIHAQLGHDLRESEDTPEGETFRRLLSAGVSREEAQRLLQSFALEDIQQQLDWLPYRDARNPARFLVAAVENRYDPPAIPWTGEDTAEIPSP